MCQTPAQATTHADNDNNASNPVHHSDCSDHFSNFDVTDNFYDFKMEDAFGIHNDDNRLDSNYINPSYPNFMKKLLYRRLIVLKSYLRTIASYNINTFSTNL